MTKRRPGNERWAAYLAGEIDLSAMDDEELARGRFKAKDGTFKGRLPVKVPRNFHQDLSLELMRRGDSEFKDGIVDAIRRLKFLAFNAEREDVQLKAVLAWIERVLGKVPEKVFLSQGRPEWESQVEKFLAGVEDEQITHAKVILERMPGPNDTEEQAARRREMYEGTSRRVEPADDWPDKPATAEPAPADLYDGAPGSRPFVVVVKDGSAEDPLATARGQVSPTGGRFYRAGTDEDAPKVDHFARRNMPGAPTFGPPGTPGPHPEFDRGDEHLAASEDGEPTYSRDAG